MECQQTIEQLKQENEALRAELEQLRVQVQRSKLERAIHNDRLSQRMAADMEQFYPEPTTPWYICILFYGDSPENSRMPEKTQPPPEDSPLESVSHGFEEMLASYGQPFFFEVSGVVACLLNVNLEDAAEETGNTFSEALRDALSRTHQATQKDTSVSHIAISQISRMEQGPRVPYRSAVSAAEQRRSDSPAVCVEEMRDLPSKETLNQIFSLEPLFWRQIQQHTFYDAATTLDSLIQLTSLDQRSLERTRAAVFSRMEIVLQTTIQENGEPSLDAPELAWLLPALSTAGTYQEMREVSYDILATLEDRFYTPPNARNRKMVSIEKYIANNYTDQMMSAASIAERFKISPSYLSRIFKADMGIGIVEYIHRVRVDAAKRLLENDALTIDAVAVGAGFSNRWVLTRVFKKLSGMTPGVYRSQLHS